jgi:hypothetical protein
MDASANGDPPDIAHAKPTPSAQAVRAHLAAGRFSKREQEVAIAWLAGMGHIEGRTVSVIWH